MALRLRSTSYRLASLLSTCESPLFKSARALSTELETSSNEEAEQTTTFVNKKRYAFMLGYRGEKYYGISMNPGQDEIPTVSKDILLALRKEGYIDDSYLESSTSVSQASRTDTGVSALRNLLVIDLKEPVDLDKVRPHLSEDIRLYGMVKTIKYFVPFRYCYGRSYLYYIPSYVFAPLSMEMHPDYRLTSETKDKIQRTLNKFLGVKNYHNFTRSRSFHDSRAVRVIKSIELLEPVIKDGMELACIRLQGESFILNQIRKMVAAVVSVVRGYAPEEMIDIALSEQGVEVCRAPPNGLMLEGLDFHHYNKRFGKMLSPIDFSGYDAEVEVLKQRILSGMVGAEMKYETTKLWTERLQYMPFEPFNRGQRRLDSTLEYDETLNIVRSESVPIAGKNAAALFI